MDYELCIRLERGSELDPETGCWIWTGRINDGGYGIIWAWGKAQPVHRVAHKLYIGPIPDGFHVDHVFDRGCRHRNCWNPGHIEAVTQAENNRRIPNRSSINAEIAGQVRSAYGSGRKQAVIAALFGITQGRVSSICSGRVWAASNDV